MYTLVDTRGNDLTAPEVPSLSKVAILLCTYQGQHYLRDQLDSFANQTHANWSIWASDDGSQDETHAILMAYQAKWGNERLSIHFGPKEGFAANFLSLTCHAKIQADFYAYSDQDDVWMSPKLARAVACLSHVDPKVPALYCSRTQLIDADGVVIGLSPLIEKKPSFANALVQNIAGGNTMVFNDAARLLLCEVGENIEVMAHDWWLYLAVSGCGGVVFYDSEPSLLYRQHDGNLIGANSSWIERWMRIKLLWRGSFKNWNDANVTALQKIYAKLTPENQLIFKQFVTARHAGFLARLIGLKKSGIYKQTLLGNLGLLFAALFNKV